MIFFLLSIILVYPEKGARIDESLIVLSDINREEDLECLIDGIKFTGKIENGSTSIVLYPSNIKNGLHSFTAINGRDTLTSTFILLKKFKGKMNYGLSGRMNYTDFDYPSFRELTGFVSLDYSIIHTDISLTTSENQEQQKKNRLLLSLIPYRGLNFKIGDQYPRISSLTFPARRLYGVGINIDEPFLLHIFYGDLYRRTPTTPKTHSFGFLSGLGKIGDTYFLIQGVRTLQEKPWTQPYDNLVAGIGMGFTLNNIKVDYELNGSIYTRDRSDTSLVNIPDWLFTINSSTIPLYPTIDLLGSRLKIHSKTRELVVLWTGRSFYNKSTYGIPVNWLNISYRDKYKFKNSSIYLAGGISRSAYTRFNLSLFLYNIYGNFFYSLNPYDTHIIGIKLYRFFNLENVLTISDNIKREMWKISFPILFNPGLKIEFSDGFPPFYEIIANATFKGLNLSPSVSIYNRCISLRLSSHYRLGQVYFSLSGATFGKNYRVYAGISTSGSNRF